MKHLQFKRKNLTVKDLKDSIERYLSSYGKEDDSVVIVDDWTPTRYFDVDFATGGKYSRLDPKAPNYKEETGLFIITDLMENELK